MWPVAFHMFHLCPSLTPLPLQIIFSSCRLNTCNGVIEPSQAKPNIGQQKFTAVKNSSYFPVPPPPATEFLHARGFTISEIFFLIDENGLVFREFKYFFQDCQTYCYKLTFRSNHSALSHDRYTVTSRDNLL